MSASGGPSADLRAGRQATNIREIPIQRSASAFAPSLGGIMGSGVRPIGTTAAPPPTHNEYYRREVLTRTLVTRSTEALSAPPPLSRSPPAAPPAPAPLRPLDVDLPPRDQLSEEYWVRYSRNIEEEERRLRSEQEHRRRAEEERRLRVEEQRRRLEQQEQELVEKLRREREQLGKTLEAQMIDRERAERDRIRQDRLEREAAERRRREVEKPFGNFWYWNEEVDEAFEAVDEEKSRYFLLDEWDRIERDRRAYEEAELEKRRELERIERERLERERLEAERLERERLERQKQELERIEKQRLEQERVERERLEIERLEIERIERIKREKREQEEREKERQRQEAARLQKVREELEKAERERLELERQARELYEREQREEAERQREREREAQKEAQRREEERLARERLERAEREAMEREIARRARERAEHERLEILRKEKERIEQEQMEAEKRERERLEQERREREMIEDAILARERRDQERREERERERQRQEEERLEQERRQRERVEAQQRERDRQMQEQQERDRLAHLEAQAAERRAHRALEERQQRERLELERRAEELREMERLEQEKRERERAAEELRLAELRDQEQRMAAERERERREAQEREERRQREGWRSREMLEQLARERDEKAAWEAEKRRLLEEHEIQERKRQGLTSKETLERLTRRPYYSRENLADYPDMTTKVERQVIERVDRTLWTDTTDTRPASHNGLTPLYYGGPSSNGMPPPLYGGDLGPPPTEGEDYTSGGREPSRLYQPRADEQDWLRRGASSRTSKYRQRMERARKEFITGTPSEYPPSSYDPLLDRYRKSTEDLLYGRRPPSEYRGPLLQRFNSGEFSHPPEPTIGLASGLGRSPYEQLVSFFIVSSQEFQRLLEKARRSLAHYYRLKKPPSYWSHTGLDVNELNKGFEEKRDFYDFGRRSAPEEDFHRSKSVLDSYSPTSRERLSRREYTEQESSHTRSKSADYLMDPRRPREEPTIPENDLQKGLLGEHELRFRKSTERMQVPDWYRDYYRQQQPPGYGIGPPSATTSGVFSAGTAPTVSTGYPYTRQEPPISSLYGKEASRPWQYTQQQPPPTIYGSPPLGGISFPSGMFDKYKEEIEDLRRSRGSLHQLGLGGERESRGTTATHPQEHTKQQQQPKLIVEGNTVTREYSREAFSKTEVQTLAYPQGSHQPGYTVSTVPSEWRMAPKERQNSRVVEVVDTFVDRPTTTDGQQPQLGKRYGGRVTLEESQSQFRNVDGPGIFTPNQALMEKLAEQPQLAEQLLRNEPIYVRCAHCQLIRSLPEARSHYCWCRHCYTYYCSRSCRQRDWERHRDKCSFARINSLCKEVIMKVRRDPETQFHMSRVAREGFRREGRGSVNIRLISAYSAQLYLEKGWQIFARHDPNQLLFYYPIQALIDQRKEPSLIQLCRKYNPNEKFILSVSIIADVEQCPETPPPLEPINNDKNNNFNKTREGPSTGFGQEFVYGTAVPTNV
uniref:MYND-type domain-containing protein n=1 Tax=Meloidogyne hapla TaxID=6305 RepID=A0A1I8BY47_MELHA